MRVREVIEELQKLDPELPVYGLEESSSCCNSANYDEIGAVHEDVETEWKWDPIKKRRVYTEFKVAKVTVY